MVRKLGPFGLGVFLASTITVLAVITILITLMHFVALKSQSYSLKKKLVDVEESLEKHGREAR